MSIIAEPVKEPKKIKCDDINNKKVISLILIGTFLVIALGCNAGFSFYRSGLVNEFIYTTAINDGMATEDNPAYQTYGRYMLDQTSDEIYIRFDLEGIIFDSPYIYLFIDFYSFSSDSIEIEVYNVTNFVINNKFDTEIDYIGIITPANPYIVINDYLLNDDLMFAIKLKAGGTANINSISGVYGEDHVETSIVSDKISFPDWIQFVEYGIYILSGIVGGISLIQFIYSIIVGKKNNCQTFGKVKSQAQF